MINVLMRLRRYVVSKMETSVLLKQLTNELNLTQLLVEDAELNRKSVKSEFVDGLYAGQGMAFRHEIDFLENLIKRISNDPPVAVSVNGKSKTAYFIAQIWQAGKHGLNYVSSPTFNFNVVNKEARTAAELLFGTPVALNARGRYSNADNTMEVSVQAYD